MSKITEYQRRKQELEALQPYPLGEKGDVQVVCRIDGKGWEDLTPFGGDAIKRLIEAFDEAPRRSFAEAEGRELAHLRLLAIEEAQSFLASEGESAPDHPLARAASDPCPSSDNLAAFIDVSRLAFSSCSVLYHVFSCRACFSVFDEVIHAEKEADNGNT